MCSYQEQVLIIFKEYTEELVTKKSAIKLEIEAQVSNLGKIWHTSEKSIKN